ncbi:MAG: hypothetical protein IPJ30_14895 [Acidobacteria bacterium]|nr:hypothetical protein [Acidobacteriota bacterium]
MDALLEIIIPSIKEIDGLKVTQPVYEWDGIEYPQGPKVVTWGSVVLSFDEKQQYLLRYLPSNYLNDEWTWLEVSNATLDAYENAINGDSTNHVLQGLGEFLRVFLNSADWWVLAFLLQDDQIDQTYRMNVENCVTYLELMLKRSSRREGFVIHK